MTAFTREDRVRQGYEARVRSGPEHWTYGPGDYESDAQDWDLDECVEYARGLAADLGRKFTDDDVGEFAELAPAAVRYLTATTSTFEYIREMRGKWTGAAGLSRAQLRGVLNCLRADALREERPFAARFPRIVAALHEAKAKAQERADTKAERYRGRARGVAGASILVPVGERVVKLSVAGELSRYTGDIHVAERGFDGAYFGRVDHRTGEASGQLADHADVVAVLEELEGDPPAKIREFSRVMGRCAICGRALTNEQSIGRGIGPICAGKVGW